MESASGLYEAGKRHPLLYDLHIPSQHSYQRIDWGCWQNHSRRRFQKSRGFSEANYIVPEGSPGDELVLYANFVGVSGLHGDVVYNYKYQGAELPPETQPAATEYEPSSDIDSEIIDTRSSKAFDPKSLKSRTGFYLTNIYLDNNIKLAKEVFVIRDGERIPVKDYFQLRIGDIIETDDVSIIQVLRDEDGFKGVIGPNSKMKFEDADLEHLKNMRDELNRQIGLKFCGQFGLLVTWACFSEEALNVKGEVSPSSSSESNCRRIINMEHGTAEVKHTLFICEQTSDVSILKVLNGTVKFTSNVTGEEVLVNAGEMVIATATGLSPLESFDVESEKAKWEPYLSSTEAINPKEGKVIYDSWNLGSVDNGPTCSPFFTLDEPQMITYADTYHWNYGKGQASGGTISLKNGEGETFGPWSVTLESGSEASNVWWRAHPNEVIPAGTYTIVDSDPETWSKNSESPCGFAKVEGYAAAISISEGNGAFETNKPENEDPTDAVA